MITRRLIQLLSPVFLCLALTGARAQDVAPGAVVEPATRLEQVLASVQRHFPLIKAATADIAARDAMVRAAQGAFDPVLEGSYKNRLSGYYDGAGMESFYRKRFPALGSEMFAGIRRASGDFPGYESDLAAARGGESRIGVSLSLWRDRDFDEYRYQTATAQVEANTERYRLQADIIAALREAYVAYAQWLQAARLLGDYTELLNIAAERAAAVTRRVENGDAADILVVDNELAVLQRRSLVVDARRLLEASARKLSLYYRYEDGSPRYPVYRDGLAMPVETGVDTPDLEVLLDRVIERDPDIARARLSRQKQSLEVRLAENMAKPKVDLRVYNTRDFGSADSPLKGTENVADISFSIPLATNTARGKASAARARMTGIDHRIRQLVNQARADLEVALVNLDATRELEAIAQQELAAARQLADAEARRFEAGLSDFFQLNQREQVVAEAELKRWRAHFDHQVALADFYTVSMDMDGLGLDPSLHEAGAP